MHKWYDPKHGMFDVLDEDKVRRQYAPKLVEGDVVSTEDALDLGPDVANLSGCDLRTPEEMMAAGLDVRFDAARAELPGAGKDVVEADIFATWLALKDLDLAAHLLAWWIALDVSPEGEVEEVTPASTAIVPYVRTLPTHEWHALPLTPEEMACIPMTGSSMGVGRLGNPAERELRP